MTGAAGFFGGLARKASYTAGMMTGLLSMVVRPSQTAWRRIRRREMASRPGTLVHRAGGFRALRTMLCGSSKSDVVDTLGSPLAAGVRNHSTGHASAALISADAAFWVADTWYYPFDPSRRAAVAVQFRRGRVVSVDFLGGF